VERALSGLGTSARFRAVEELPLLRIKTPSGHTFRVLAFDGYPGKKSSGYFLEELGILFTGKLLGSFNTQDEELRAVFHKVYFPGGEVLEENLDYLDTLPEDFRVFPRVGLPDLPHDPMLRFEDFRFRRINDKDAVLVILSKVLSSLSEEEREELIAQLIRLVEFESDTPVAVHTEPHVLYEALMRALLNVVRSSESFFNILKMLSRYPFYIPLPEV